jgi:hypothetical protein
MFAKSILPYLDVRLIVVVGDVTIGVVVRRVVKRVISRVIRDIRRASISVVVDDNVDLVYAH